MTIFFYIVHFVECKVPWMLKVLKGTINANKPLVPRYSIYPYSFLPIFVVVGEAELIARSLLTLKSLLVPFGLDEGMGAGLSEG